MGTQFNLFLVLFVGLQALMAARHINAIASWLLRTSKTTGKVVSKSQRSHWSNPWGATSLNVKFFDISGAERLLKSTFADSVGFWGRWPIGANVQVQYDPRNLDNCELSISHQLTSWLVLLVIGGICNFLFMCGLIILMVRHLLEV